MTAEEEEQLLITNHDEFIVLFHKPQQACGHIMSLPLTATEQETYDSWFNIADADGDGMLRHLSLEVAAVYLSNLQPII